MTRGVQDGHLDSSEKYSEFGSCVKVEVAVPNKPYGFCGRKSP